MSNPSIAFCTTCKGRVQHLEKTLPKNLADNRDYPNCKFIVLDYNSPDHLIPYLKANHQADIESGRLAVYSTKEPGAFKMGLAKNMAHRLGTLEGTEILVNLDADNYTGPGFAAYVAEQFERAKDDIFLWARMIQTGPDRLPRGVNGRIAVRAKQFLKLGGYDEAFKVWSPDDKDFNLRLRRLGYKPQEIDRKYLDAIRHNDKIRFKEYHYVSTRPEEYDMETVSSSDTTVVNFGNFGVGTVYKNFGSDPIELRPLPTRIFGIGMHKTATTSLHQAMQLLGYDSAHWKSAHWAKAIWEEITTWGRSRTLERHYAVCDLPIPLLYEKLDIAYPGSKFILTVRDEQRWLHSIENHWNPDHNPFRIAWDTDPFSHKIHQAVYGLRTFDADVFLERYRRHNAEVREYFKDRPGDLLVMEMDRGAGWTQLCSFLNHPIPTVQYPRAFATDQRYGHGEGI